MKRAAAVITAMMLIGALVPAAHAHFRPHEDADDVGGNLDIKKVWIERVDEHTTTINVRTFDRFGKRDLIGQEGFVAHVDSRGDERYDFLITIGLYENSYPYCNVYDRAGYSRGGAQVDKTPRGMTCPLSATPFNATKQIRWRMRSFSKGETDLAPNSGWFNH